MKNTANYLAHLVEIMQATAPVTTRAMFGGHGLYVDDLIVAIVIEDVLYLKTDDENRASFAALGLEPFRYVTKEGEVHVMTYHRAPADALEGPAEMAPWLRSAHAAALRKKGSARGPGRRKTGATAK